MVSEPPTGQWLVARDGQRWWFDSGSIALDFAYTGGFPGPPEWEHWHGPEDAAQWWRERFATEIHITAADYEQARELRRMIAQAVIAASRDEPIPNEAVSVIDARAATPDVAPQLQGEPLVTADRMLASVARAAVAALRRPELVRACGADDCAVMYFDTSRSGNRNWCSMQRCGNRHKVRALRARRAASTRATEEHLPQEKEI